MEKVKKINVGIGFATGRKSFQKILKTNVYNWEESGLTEKENISLNLFVAYDLKYSNTKSTDYTNVSKDVLNLIDSSHFIGSTALQEEIDYLINENIIDKEEAQRNRCCAEFSGRATGIACRELELGSWLRRYNDR